MWKDKKRQSNISIYIYMYDIVKESVGILQTNI